MSSTAIRRIATAAVAVAVTAAIGAGAAQVALAATSVASPNPTSLSLSQVKVRCETAISHRLTFLGGLQGRVNAATVLTAEHRTALLGIVVNDQSGLAALKTKIENDTTASELRADCQAIVTDYRVYVLAGPQVHLTIAADRVDYVDDRIQSLYGKLRSALQHCTASPTECQAANQAFTDLQAKVSQSNQAVAGVASQVLALKPSGWPGIESTLDAARTAVETAHDALQGAWQDIKVIRQALDGSSSASHSPTPTP
jgi:hypothetical protein